MIQNTHRNTHTAPDSDVLGSASPVRGSVVSELMEQGEHRLAVNRRRWRRDQGALEAPLCFRTTGAYCHHIFFGEHCNIKWRELLDILREFEARDAPSGLIGLQFKGPFLLFTSDFTLIHQVIAGNMLNQTCALMIQMCQKVPQRTSAVP